VQTPNLKFLSLLLLALFVFVGLGSRNRTFAVLRICSWTSDFQSGNNLLTFRFGTKDKSSGGVEIKNMPLYLYVYHSKPSLLPHRVSLFEEPPVHQKARKSQNLLFWADQPEKSTLGEYFLVWIRESEKYTLIYHDLPKLYFLLPKFSTFWSIQEVFYSSFLVFLVYVSRTRFDYAATIPLLGELSMVPLKKRKNLRIMGRLFIKFKILAGVFSCLISQLFRQQSRPLQLFCRRTERNDPKYNWGQLCSQSQRILCFCNFY